MFLVDAFASLAGDGNLAAFIGFECAQAFDAQDVISGNSVIEHDAAIDLEVVGVLRQIVRCHISVSAAARQQRNGSGNSDQIFQFAFSILVSASGCRPLVVKPRRSRLVVICTALP